MARPRRPGAPTVEVLIVARFLQGFAGAAGVVLGRAIIADSVRGAGAARTFSWLMTIGAVAPVVAPLLGGALLGPVGWRGIFVALPRSPPSCCSCRVRQPSPS